MSLENLALPRRESRDPTLSNRDACPCLEEVNPVNVSKSSHKVRREPDLPDLDAAKVGGMSVQAYILPNFGGDEGGHVNMCTSAWVICSDRVPLGSPSLLSITTWPTASFYPNTSVPHRQGT